MACTIRTFVVPALVAFASRPAAGDPGRASDRAGQMVRPNQATLDLQREVRANRLARWKRSIARIRMRERDATIWAALADWGWDPDPTAVDADPSR